jgi:hypothetical protein
MNNKKRSRKSKRNIGMEILEGIRAIKAGKGKHVNKHIKGQPAFRRASGL